MELEFIIKGPQNFRPDGFIFFLCNVSGRNNTKSMQSFSEKRNEYFPTHFMSTRVKQIPKPEKDIIREGKLHKSILLRTRCEIFQNTSKSKPNST